MSPCECLCVHVCVCGCCIWKEEKPCVQRKTNKCHMKLSAHEPTCISIKPKKWHHSRMERKNRCQMYCFKKKRSYLRLGRKNKTFPHCHLSSSSVVFYLHVEVNDRILSFASPPGHSKLPLATHPSTQLTCHKLKAPKWSFV